MQDNNKQQLILFAYKILIDILFLLLLSFGVMLFVEAILPGFVSSHISFTKMILAILFDFATIIFLREKTKKTIQETVSKPTKKIYLYLIAIFIFTLIAFSIRHFNRMILAIILIATIFLFYYFYQLLLKKE